MQLTSARTGALLLGIGVALLTLRLLPFLTFFWPILLIGAGITLIWRLGEPVLRLGLAAGAITLALLAPGFGSEGVTFAPPHTTLRSNDSDAAMWQGARRVVLHNSLGDIRVERGESVSVAVAYRVRPGARREIPAGLEARYDERSHTLTVVGVDPALPLSQRRGLTADLRLTLPERVDVTVRSGVGDVVVRGVSGADIETDTGDIELRDLVGAIRVRNNVGDIELRNVRGVTEASTRVGDVRLRFDEPVNTPIRVAVDTGDVRLRLPRDSNVAVRASSRVRNLEGLERLGDHEGRLLLGNARATVELSTRVGQVRVDVR